jgi:hypothetical protein
LESGKLITPVKKIEPIKNKTTPIKPVVNVQTTPIKAPSTNNISANNSSSKTTFDYSPTQSTFNQYATATSDLEEKQAKISEKM